MASGDKRNSSSHNHFFALDRLDVESFFSDMLSKPVPRLGVRQTGFMFIHDSIELLKTLAGFQACSPALLFRENSRPVS